MGFLNRKKVEETKENSVSGQPVKKVIPKKLVSKEAKEVVSEETEEPKTEYRVVLQLPTKEIREETLDDGTVVQYVTLEEALTEIINEGLD